MKMGAAPYKMCRRYNNASSDNTQENGKYLHAHFAFAADLPEPFALTANKMKRMY